MPEELEEYPISENEESACAKCGKRLTESEQEDDLRFNKGPVCYECFLKFLRKKRLLGEVVMGVLSFITIILFYMRMVVFGIFFAGLIILILFDWRSVNNYIIDIETKKRGSDKDSDKNNTLK